MAVHVLNIALAGPVLPHTVRRAQSRAWPGVTPENEPMPRQGRCPSRCDAALGVMPWQELRSVNDHEWTASLVLIFEDQSSVCCLHGCVGKHHRGKAPRGARRHIPPTLLGTQTLYLTHAPWYADASFDPRSLVPEGLLCIFTMLLACRIPCGPRAAYQGAWVKRPCVWKWFRVRLNHLRPGPAAASPLSVGGVGAARCRSPTHEAWIMLGLAARATCQVSRLCPLHVGQLRHVQRRWGSMALGVMQVRSRRPRGSVNVIISRNHGQGSHKSDRRTDNVPGEGWPL